MRKRAGRAAPGRGQNAVPQFPFGSKGRKRTKLCCPVQVLCLISLLAFAGRRSAAGRRRAAAFAIKGVLIAAERSPDSYRGRRNAEKACADDSQLRATPVAYRARHGLPERQIAAARPSSKCCRRVCDQNRSDARKSI